MLLELLGFANFHVQNSLPRRTSDHLKMDIPKTVPVAGHQQETRCENKVLKIACKYPKPKSKRLRLV